MLSENLTSKNASVQKVKEWNEWKIGADFMDEIFQILRRDYSEIKGGNGRISEVEEIS